ncbi:MAG: hypothetical protein DIU78_021125, partial [Pseudomonadota bacterium]
MGFPVARWEARRAGAPGFVLLAGKGPLKGESGPLLSGKEDSKGRASRRACWQAGSKGSGFAACMLA